MEGWTQPIKGSEVIQQEGTLPYFVLDVETQNNN